MPSRLPALLPAICCLGGPVHDLAQRVPQRRFVQVVEADPQELLAGPVGEAVGQLGEPLGEPQRAQGLPDHAAQAGDDPGVVTADAREVVLQRTQPGTQGRGPVARQRGHVGARHAADVLAHGAGERAEPRFLRELGHGVDGGAHLAVGARPLARGGGERGPGGGGGLHRGGDVAGERDALLGRRIGGRPVEAADDVPEALRGRGDGVAFPHGVARDAGRCRWRRPRRPGGPARRGRSRSWPSAGSVGTP